MANLVRVTGHVEGLDNAAAFARSITNPAQRVKLLSELASYATREGQLTWAHALQNEAILIVDTEVDISELIPTWKTLGSNNQLRATGRPAAALARLTSWSEMLEVAPPDAVRAIADELALVGVISSSRP